MNETQESISQWAEETFGPVGSNVRVAARANEEMAELLRALSADENSPKAAEEAADVAIVLCRLAQRMDMRFRLNPQQDDKGWAPSNLATAAMANYAMADLVNCLAVDDFSEFANGRTREVAFWLFYLSRRMGFKLREEVDKKMAINRARQWNLDHTGHGYHVRDKSELQSTQTAAESAPQDARVGPV